MSAMGVKTREFGTSTCVATGTEREHNSIDVLKLTLVQALRTGNVRTPCRQDVAKIMVYDGFAPESRPTRIMAVLSPFF